MTHTNDTMTDLTAAEARAVASGSTADGEPSAVMYGQLVDRTGQAAAGVGMALVERTDGRTGSDGGGDGGDRDGTERGAAAVIGTTVSDSNGAFFLPYRLRQPDGARWQLELSVADDALDLDQPPADGSLWGPHSLVVPRQQPTPTGVSPRRPLLDEEALVDVWKHPSLSIKPTPAWSQSACGPASPGEVPSRVFAFSQYAMFPQRSGDFDLRSVTAAIDLRPPESQGSRLRYGAVVEYRQEWWERASTLGDLLYSVPLAPCEQVKLAVLDWRRRDFAVQQTTLDENHFQDSTITRTQNIDESLRLWSDKNLDATTESGAIGVTIGPVSGGYGKTFSNVNEVVNATSDATRDVNDTITQVTNTVRNTRSFSIAEVTQEEESTVTTRVISNHNHSHTLTFQYYEVLQVFLLRTRVNQIRPVLFVPFGIKQFTSTDLATHGYVLRRALLDPTLAPVLDEYLGALPPRAASPQAPGMPALPAAPGDTGDEPAEDDDTVTALRLSGVTDATGIGSVTLRVNGVDIPANWTGPFEFLSGAVTGMHLSGIERAGFRVNGSGLFNQPAVIYDVVLQAEVAGTWRTLAYWDRVDVPANETPTFVRLVSGVARPPVVTPTTTEPELTRLLAHLNAYAAYYTTALVAGGDPGLRYLMLSLYRDDAGNALADIVDNTVVASVGNHLAFPLRSLEHLPAELRAGIESADQLMPAGTTDERIVTLPTPGIFAESQLGRCNASEVIDDSRFWNWQTSPCPDEAPDITADMLASRYQSPDALVQVVRSDLEPSPVQIPELPEPMIKIGDETLKELVSGLDIPDASGLLELVQGLAQIGSEHSLEVFKEIWGAYTGKAGGPGSGATSTGGTGAGGAGGATGGGAAGNGAGGNGAGGAGGAGAAGGAQGAGLSTTTGV